MVVSTCSHIVVRSIRDSILTKSCHSSRHVKFSVYHQSEQGSEDSKKIQSGTTCILLHTVLLIKTIIVSFLKSLNVMQLCAVKQSTHIKICCPLRASSARKREVKRQRARRHWMDYYLKMYQWHNWPTASFRNLKPRPQRLSLLHVFVEVVSAVHFMFWVVPNMTMQQV
jgi:hypothetical protein